MPRTYKPDPRSKRYVKHNEDDMKKALQDMERTGLSYREASKKYKIHRSVLHRHSTKEMKNQGGQLSVDPKIEEYLIENLKVCAAWGYPMDLYDLRLIIKGYLDRLGVEIRKFKNNLPGTEYGRNFLKRHKHNISLRTAQNIKRARAEVTAAEINTYFDNLSKVLENVPLQNIVNYDETNLADDPAKKKVIVKRGCKYPERVMNNSKASTSIMLAVSADGEMLAPYTVYKSAHLYDTWTANGPMGARYNRSKSGWFDSICFEDWVKTTAFTYLKDKPGKKILIGDNLSSHLSIELINWSKNHDIDFVFLPANSTHITQPLDVAFFRPLKQSWREILLQWKKNEGRKETSIPKGYFPRLLKKLCTKISVNAKENILSGFRKTGIVPLQRNEVLARLPDSNVSLTKDDDENRKAVDESILSILKELRHPNIERQKKRRKLNVEAGKSTGNLNEIPENPTNQKPLKGKGKGKRSCTVTNLPAQRENHVFIQNEEPENLSDMPDLGAEIEIIESSELSPKDATGYEVVTIYDESGKPVENGKLKVEASTSRPKLSKKLKIGKCVMCNVEKNRGEYGWAKCMACKLSVCPSCNDGSCSFDYICLKCLGVDSD